MVFNAMPETWSNDCDVTFDVTAANLDSMITHMEKKDVLSKRSNAQSNNNS